MNANEFGNHIRVGAGEDISGNTNFLHLISPAPNNPTTIKLAADGLTVPDIPFVDGSISFDADEYVQYQLQDGDIDIQGDWTARLFTQPPGGTIQKITDVPLTFTVGE